MNTTERTGTISINSGLPVAIINDCRDRNALGRQESRFHAEFLRIGVIAKCVSLGFEHPLEGALNVIDQLDALGGEMGAISHNGAPRNTAGSAHENGAPFCAFQYRKIWTLATFDSAVLSLIRKLDIVPSVFVVHTKDTVLRMKQDGFVPEELVDEVVGSQFRSYEFVPRLCAYIFAGHRVCSTEVPVSSAAKPFAKVAYIDCFGNCKTTVRADEVCSRGTVPTAWGELPYFEHLKDVPVGEAAVIRGSSGLPGKRLAVVVGNGGNAAQAHGIRVGDDVF